MRDRAIPWGDVANATAQQAIAVDLKDGSHLTGVGIGTEGDDLVMKVARSSSPRQHPKGQSKISRTQVLAIKLPLRNSASRRGSAIGIGVGIAAGAPVAFKLGSQTNSNAGAGIAVLVGAAVAGWLIGHQFDGPTVERITIIP